MIKKIIPVLLCLCLSFSVACYGENTADTQETQMPPMGEMPPRGNMPQNGEMPDFGEMPPRGNMPQNGEMPDFGEMPQRGQGNMNFQGGEMPPRGEKFTQPAMEKPAEITDAPAEEVPTTGEETTENQSMDGNKGNWGNRGMMPSFGQSQQEIAPVSFFETYFDAIASVILLVLAFIFVIFYKRRQY